MKQERLVATAKYQSEIGEAIPAYLMSRTSTKHGRHVQGYRWLDESLSGLDGMSRGHSAARMLEAARRNPRFVGIVVMNCDDDTDF